MRLFPSLLAAVWVLATLARPAGAQTNLPPSPNPPGGLAPSNAPQLILLTFDDLIDSNRAALVDLVLTNHWNPNGSPIQATFFVNTDWSDYRALRRFHDRGHEIAVHTMTHTTGTNTDLRTWRAEIAGCRKALADHGGIPAAAIRGFRAPYMMYNDAMFRILEEQGFLYDASVIETPGTLSAGGSSYIWPYTLHDGVKQTPWTGILPTNTFPGLFEIPMWELLDGAGMSVAVMDPAGSQAAILSLLKTNFLARYNGNRAPLGVFLHADWLSLPTHRAALNAFIDWTLAGRSDAWWISSQDLLAFMRAPVNSAAALAFGPFVSVTNPPPPTNLFRRCVYDIGAINSCTNCPIAYPRPDSIYVEPSPIPGGTLKLELLNIYSTSYWARLTVSNTAPTTVIEWAASFDIINGGVSAIADGLCSMQGSRATIQPDLWLRPLMTNEVEIVEFGGPRTGDVAFTNAVLQLYEQGPQHPELRGLRSVTNGSVVLDWDDSAFGYRVERASRLNPPDWSPVADVYAATSLTNAPPATGAYYRLRAVP